MLRHKRGTRSDLWTREEREEKKGKAGRKGERKAWKESRQKRTPKRDHTEENANVLYLLFVSLATFHSLLYGSWIGAEG